jgi:hypothetical protein
MAVPAPAAIRLSEKDFQRQVIDLGRLCGWKVQHQTISYRSEPGWPDLVMVRNGRIVFAELKTERGRVSDAQSEWLAALNQVALANAGVHVGVFRPSDWADLERVLR